MIPFIEAPNVLGDSATQKVNKRKNEPHPRNALFFAKLALVEGELLLTVSEEYFNIPAFCVDVENFLCGKLCMSRYKHSKCPIFHYSENVQPSFCVSR